MLARRRAAAALLAGLAVLTAIRAAQGPPEPTVPVVVAAADLPGGVTVTAADLDTVDFPASTVPEGVTRSPTDVVGRVVAAPLRRGEPLTDVRLVAAGLLEGYPGRVAVPIRVADVGSVGLLRVGDRVDVVATPPDGGPATVVAAAAPVAALPREAEGTGPVLPGSGGLVVLAVSRDDALELTAATHSMLLGVIVAG